MSSKRKVAPVSAEAGGASTLSSASKRRKIAVRECSLIVDRWLRFCGRVVCRKDEGVGRKNLNKHGHCLSLGPSSLGNLTPATAFSRFLTFNQPHFCVCLPLRNIVTMTNKILLQDHPRRDPRRHYDNRPCFYRVAQKGSRQAVSCQTIVRTASSGNRH